LGLSICKKIVETFEGNIVVSSKIGQGSTFKFSIKIPRQEQQSQELNVHQIIIEDVNAINYEGSQKEEQQ